MTPFRTDQLVVGDVRSPVLVGGTGDRDEAVVFVHGNPDGGADWLPLMEPVSEFARVVAPDMPGFAGAEKRADMDYTLAGYARHLGGVIDALGVRRVHLVAHDFGGPFALTWAAANTDRVGSVTLVNTGVLLDYAWHRAARLWRTPVVGELFTAAAVPAVTRAWLRNDNPGLDPRWIEHIAGISRPAGTKRAVLRLYRSTTQQMMDRLVGPLREADLPCQVIWGTNDVYIPTEQAYRQREPFPSARIATVEGAGHWVWLERPDDVLAHLLPFLREQVRTTATTTTTAVHD